MTKPENPGAGGENSNSGSDNSGNGSGGGSASGPASVNGPGQSSQRPAPAVRNEPLQGQWVQDEKGWRFQEMDQQQPANAWAVINGSWYLFDEQGYMQTGWYENPDGQWFYLNESGAMTTGWQKVGNTWYYMQENGVMARDTVIDGFWLNSEGQWV